MVIRAATPEIIQEMVERIVRQFDPVKVILFGSQARGDAGPDSDVDLLVVMDDVADLRSASVQVGASLADMPVSKDVIVTTPQEMERYGAVPGSIIRYALQEGRAVYERK